VIGCGLFAVATTLIVADVFEAEVARGAIQPTGEDDIRLELLCLFREQDEHVLRDVAGGVRVAQLTKRGGVNQIDVTSDNLVEGVLGSPAGKFCEQFTIGHGVVQ